MNRKSFTRTMGVGALALVLGACAGTAKKESTGEYLDDSVLTAKVKAALLNDPMVSGFAVNVETFKGVVQLSGFVKTTAERNQAAKLAQGVAGVKDVKNDIRLR